MRTTLLGFTALTLLFALGSPALGQDDTMAPGYLGSLTRDFGFVSGRLVELAEAIPADKYGWRPAEGVRSVSELFMHVAMANYFLGGHVGIAMPQDLDRDAEKNVTKKEDVIAALKASQKHVLEGIATKTEADLEPTAEFFDGQQHPIRDYCLVLSSHSHEHLGQAIAYARMNGVVPPWSQPAGGGE